MANLLEITGDDIAALSDSDLRDLIGELCEADYRMAGLSTKGITWGGHQDARDGGLDVVVRDETNPPQTSFVPRKTTGFQVKKPDMPKAAILEEMKPGGVLREEIKNLIKENGAYIIVSSSGSTANTALRNRQAAMHEAVAEEPDWQNIHLEFYDRGRVATWVRSHPSLILWVRNRIGRQLTGWRPYENWANAPSGTEEEYLLDDGLRMRDGINTRDKGIPGKEGLEKIRSALSTPATSVRLAGLSGVGKTRLVQALFDERIGENPLNKTQAYYADISDNLDPDPKTFAEQLIAYKTRAILIVDNCPPDLHRRLTKVCSQADSTVSLITIEYDVRDDIQEETSVFRLDPASNEVIEKLVKKRFPHISQVDARTIAEFSGGNARVAIALANTVKHGETLSGLRDEELFQRLFQQRNDPSDDLLVSAKVCSLVYSFDGEDADSEKSELKLLASLVDKSGSELFRDVSILKERDLIQSRGVWRAVLPHAIANRLAKRAFESIPKDKLVSTFLNGGSERLIKSFSRRLSYLHDCDQAIEIVNDWLAPGGWIGKENCDLNPFGMEIFRNIAPVSPEKALEAMERAANGNNGPKFTSRESDNYYQFVGILRRLAYDPKLFKRSIELICRYALSEKPGENYNSIRDVLKNLFYIYLSGTHASAEMRAEVIKDLIDSGQQDKQDLGFFLLDAALEAWHFSSSYDFGFGARSRDYGYYPRSREEIIQWYEIFIGICTRLALSGQPIAKQAKKVLSDNLRGLWTKVGMFDVVEKSIKQIHEQQPWNEAWIAVKEIIRYDIKFFEKEVSGRLKVLEKQVRPRDLLERARTFALSDERFTFDLEEDADLGKEGPELSRLERIQEITHQIGIQVAQRPDIFEILLPDLVSTNNYRLNSFGRGLADGCEDKKKYWDQLYMEIERTPVGKRQITVLTGFLSSCAVSDPDFFNTTLDALVNDDLLGKWFPVFQTTATIDQRGIQRLLEALDAGKAKIYTFKQLAWKSSPESISDDDMAILLEKIISKEEGLEVAVEILRMRFDRSGGKQREYSKKLVALACDVLVKYPLDEGKRKHSSEDYEIDQISKICLKGESGRESAIVLCQHLAEAIVNDQIQAFDYPSLFNNLAHSNPMAFLDYIVGNKDIKSYQLRMMLGDDIANRNGSPLDQISINDLVTWCDCKPENRYLLIASVMQLFTETEEKGKLAWKPIVETIFEKAPQLDNILECLSRSIRPSGWSGSLADALQKRLILFQSLSQHHNAEIRAWAKQQHSSLQETIMRQREWEEKESHERNERFE